MRYSLLLSIAVSFLAAGAEASSCMPPTLKEAVNKAQVIFKGTVSKVEFIEPRRAALIKDPAHLKGDCGDKYVTFAVETVWKGKADKESVVYSSDGCVGLGGYFHAGERKIMFLTEDKEYGLSTFVCNAPASDIDETKLKELTDKD